MAKQTRWKAIAVCVLLACSGCAASPHSANANTSASPATTHASGVESDSARAVPTALTISDPRGDLVSASKEADWFEEARPVPQQVWGDITGTRIRHTATEILIQVRFADLHPRSQGDPKPMFRLGTVVETNTGLDRDVELWIPDEDPNLPAIQMLSKDAERVACHLDHAINISHGIVTEHIPRMCLGNPQWVRVNVNCLAYPADDKTMTLDVASVDGYDPAREDVLTPPIYRRSTS